MSFVCGIYGYHITLPIDLPDLDLRIEPLTGNYTDANLRVNNFQSYQLTAILKGKGKSIPTNVLFNLEAILSFIESRDVLITPAEDLTNEESPFSQFPESIAIPLRGKASKVAILEDSLSPTARTSFIINALARFNYESGELEKEQKIEIEELSKVPLFNALFFKYVETFRQPRMPPDISYYLLFSGLEAFAYYWAKKTGVVKEHPPGLICNKCQYLVSSEPCPTCKKCGNLTPKKPRDLPVSTVIYEFLKEDGEVFGATDGLKANTAKKEYDPYAAMAAYAHLRNKLVHENKVSSNSFKNDKNIIVPLNMFHYLDRLEKLVQLVILKKVGFDDDGTNYKAWLNLQ